MVVSKDEGKEKGQSPAGALATWAWALVVLVGMPLLWLKLKLTGPVRRRVGGQPLAVNYIKCDAWSGRFAGGALGHLLGLCMGLRGLGHRVRIFATQEIPEARSLGIDVASVVGGSCPRGVPLSIYILAENARLVRSLLPEFRRARPDLIYQRAGLLNCTGVLLAELTGVPLALEYNSPATWRREASDRLNPALAVARLIAERVSLAGAATVSVVSEVLREIVVQKGVPASGVIVNPNGADCERFRPDIDGGPVRAALGLRDRFVVGFSGYYGPYHGVENLARSIKTVALEVPEARFLFMGDERLEQVVRGICREDGTEGRVHILLHVPPDRMPAHLAACDVLASPHTTMADGSRFFGSPVKLFEYMAMGKAIVASRVEQLASVLSDGKEALLVTAGDPAELANALVRLHREPDLSQRLGAGARERCLGQYTWEHNARRVVDSVSAS